MTSIDPSKKSSKITDTTKPSKLTKGSWLGRSIKTDASTKEICKKTSQLIKNLKSDMGKGKLTIDEAKQEIQAAKKILASQKFDVRESIDFLAVTSPQSMLYDSEEVAEIEQVEKKLTSLEKDIAIAETLDLPFSELAKHPEFMQFIKANHLHHRIDASYKERGLGLSLKEGELYVKMRQEGTTEAKEVPWYTLLGKTSREEASKLKGRKDFAIKKYSLMAYGWEKHDPEKAKELIPVKIIHKSEKPFSRGIELVTAKAPKGGGSILDRWGHSWINMYEPVYDKDGNETDQLKVYSFGYFLRNKVIVPDKLEFVKRERVSSHVPLTPEQLSQTKGEVNALLKLQTLPPESEEVEAITDDQLQAVHEMRKEFITCAHAATKIFQISTGVHIRGDVVEGKFEPREHAPEPKLSPAELKKERFSYMGKSVQRMPLATKAWHLGAQVFSFMDTQCWPENVAANQKKFNEFQKGQAEKLEAFTQQSKDVDSSGRPRALSLLPVSKTIKPLKLEKVDPYTQ